MSTFGDRLRQAAVSFDRQLFASLFREYIYSLEYSREVFDNLKNGILKSIKDHLPTSQQGVDKIIWVEELIELLDQPSHSLDVEITFPCYGENYIDFAQTAFVHALCFLRKATIAFGNQDTAAAWEWLIDAFHALHSSVRYDFWRQRFPENEWSFDLELRNPATLKAKATLTSDVVNDYMRDVYIQTIDNMRIY